MYAPFKTDFKSNTALPFRKHGVLKVTDLFTLQAADLMYKNEQNKFPNYI